MISASHNPAADNGIKFFARGGTKLPDEVEDAIEARLGEEWDRPQGADVGTITSFDGAVESYVEHLVSTLQRPLTGGTVVADCANGAASITGPEALRRAGATRSEEHTSELQSRGHLVCRLLLENKKTDAAPSH